MTDDAPAHVVFVDRPDVGMVITTYRDGRAVTVLLTPARALDLAAELLQAARRHMSDPRRG